MQIEEIKQIIKGSTAVLVLDNGEPSFVILGYKMYKDLVADKVGEKEIKINQAQFPKENSYNGYSPKERETEILERLNKEILAIKNQIEMEERGLSSQSVD